MNFRMSFVTLTFKKSTGQQVYVDAGGAVSQQAPDDVKILVDRKNPFKVAAYMKNKKLQLLLLLLL